MSRWRLCSVKGCERVHCAKGFCRAHYQRLVLKLVDPDSPIKTRGLNNFRSAKTNMERNPAKRIANRPGPLEAEIITRKFFQ